MKVQGRAVLILPDPMPEKTKGGLAIPKTAENTGNTGVIVNCGPECNDAEKGKRVIFLKKNTSKMEIDGIEHFFGMESCIQYIYE